jgi:hypothetical protein
MPKLLPGPRGYPDKRLDVTLDDVPFRVRWLYSERAGVWTFYLSDSADQPIVSGVRVVLNVDLLDGVADERRPPGPLLVVNPSGDEEPTLETLGNGVSVVYLTAADIAT